MFTSEDVRLLLKSFPLEKLEPSSAADSYLIPSLSNNGFVKSNAVEAAFLDAVRNGECLSGRSASIYVNPALRYSIILAEILDFFDI